MSNIRKCQYFVFGVRDKKTGKIDLNEYLVKEISENIIISNGETNEGFAPIPGYKVMTRPSATNDKIYFSVYKLGEMNSKSYTINYHSGEPQFHEEYIDISPTHDYVIFCSVLDIDASKFDEEVKRVLTSKFFTDKKLFLRNYTTEDGIYHVNEKSK